MAYAILGAAIEVHRNLGAGFGELVYERALCVELGLRGIDFARQAKVAIAYKGQVVGEGRLDLIVADLVVLELKAVESLQPLHTAQLLSYLKATQKPLGLLLNFNAPVLVAKRVVHTLPLPP